jgi:DNA-binding transcriptional LysR family regulator
MSVLPPGGKPDIKRTGRAMLFRRMPRGVELTDAGRAFLDNARATLAQFDYTFETTRRAARGEQGRICVCYTIQTAVHPLFLRVIREFREAFPVVSVTLAHGFPRRTHRTHAK